MPTKMSRYPVFAFMLIACGYSWGWWLLMIASQKGWLPLHLPAGPWGSFGPLFAALLLCRASGIAPTSKAFLRTTVRAWPGWSWLALALALPLLFVLGALLVHGSLAGFPSLDWSKAYVLPLLFLLILVLGGPVGEEFGWRGFVLPAPLRRWSPLSASVLLALLWLLWHLPLFWLEGAAQEGTSIAGFALMVLCASLLFTWFWLRTGPGLWPVLVLHTSINLWSFVLPAASPGLENSPTFTRALLGMFVVAAFAAVLGDRRMRRWRVDRTEASGT
jgi:hypothetical protein